VAGTSGLESEIGNTKRTYLGAVVRKVFDHCLAAGGSGDFCVPVLTRRLYVLAVVATRYESVQVNAFLRIA
jgi:hypothetical protein